MSQYKMRLVLNHLNQLLQPTADYNITYCASFSKFCILMTALNIQKQAEFPVILKTRASHSRLKLNKIIELATSNFKDFLVVEVHQEVLRCSYIVLLLMQ